MGKNFDLVLEQIYNTFDRNKNPVQYVGPDEAEQYIDDILRFIESDTQILSALQTLNTSNNATHQSVVDFWNLVIGKANQSAALQNVPENIWTSLRDSAFSRVKTSDPDHDFLQSPAWEDQGQGQEAPSVLQAFDWEMQMARPENRVPLNTYLKTYQTKGLGKQHMFALLRATMRNSLNPSPEQGQIQGITPALAAAAY